MVKRVQWQPLLVSSLDSSSTETMSFLPPNCHQITLGYANLERVIIKMSRMFYCYGKFCASHPWEVMVAFLTLSIVIFSVGPKETYAPVQSPLNSSGNGKEIPNGDVILTTLTRCLALLYVYHQFKNLCKQGSKYLVGISGLFTVFSSFIFSSGVINFLNGDFTELNKAMPLFLLLSDLSKASLLAQFALSSFSREEVRENIARGMAILGPSLTLDTMVETLAIGVGTLSGVKRMEELSGFACLSVIVNYIIFMTFFPACLSLALELSHSREEGKPVWQLSSLTKVLQVESEQAPNPVIQRVKVIMSAGLMLVHMLSRWPNGADDFASNLDHNASEYDSNVNEQVVDNFPSRDGIVLEFHLRKWFAVGYEQVVMLGLVFALAVKYIFFDNKDSINENLISAAAAHQQQQQQQQQQLEQQQQLQKEHFQEEQFLDETEKEEETALPDNDNDNDAVESSCRVKVKSGRSISVASKGNDSIDTPVIVISQDSDTESVIVENNGKRASSVESKSETPQSFFIGDDFSSDFGEELEVADKEVQTDNSDISEVLTPFKRNTSEPREMRLLVALLNSEDGAKELTDDEVLLLVEAKHLQAYRLESALGDPVRGVYIRRLLLERQDPHGKRLSNLPYLSYDYSLVLGACCENVVGYMPIPVGIAGPLIMDGNKYHVPMATTEGCLVASTNRGCRALALGKGVRSSVVGDGMTRGPVVRFPTAMRAAEVLIWLEEEDNFLFLKSAFDSTSRFARLTRMQTRIASRYLFIRLVAKTGDAMGMNMLSKGAEIAMQTLKGIFPDMELIGLSGNVCTDKKPSAVNWIEGRGKSVVCEAEVPAQVVRDVLKTNVLALVELNVSKNLIGSSMAGSIGGFNAHAANIVTAVFIATGQDPAQNVGSSNCITLIEPCGHNNEDLYISCTMPSIELGTIGGGTILPAQASCLELLGVRGSSQDDPGRNAKQLARIVCSTVLAAELSVLSAIAAGHMVRAHMKHNRSNVSINYTPHHRNSRTSISGLTSTALSSNSRNLLPPE